MRTAVRPTKRLTLTFTKQALTSIEDEQRPAVAIRQPGEECYYLLGGHLIGSSSGSTRRTSTGVTQESRSKPSLATSW
jgi:hypothetical protein